MASVSTPEVYKTWDDGYIVRRMIASDTKVVEHWFTDLAATACDLDVALSLFPEDAKGFYTGEFQGQVVASAIRIPNGNGIYYGSFYYVEEEFRGRRFGTRLRDEVAAKHVGDAILVIDAVAEVEQMNHRKGYTSGFRTNYYKGPPKHLGTPIPDGIRVTQGSEVDFEAILAFDNQCYVQPNSDFRRRLLEKWMAIPGGKSSVAVTSNNEVIGFGCRRPALVGPHHQVGPLYAINGQIARIVLDHLTSDLDVDKERIWLTICMPNSEAVKLVYDLGLELHLPLVRMYLNGDPKEFKPQVFALTSVEICGF